jgi:hypothetical protein
MNQETFGITADSPEEARPRSKAKIPQGFFLHSERILSDGKPVSIREIVESMEDAVVTTRAKLPSEFAFSTRKRLDRF